jgi:glycosyltransferase involved in cell wall biosynthesis
MAWNDAIQRKLGPPPEWAECLPAGDESPRQFLAGLHCLAPLSGGAQENWPRCGLEAMAAGVPIVAENRWGWQEMIRHGRTGYLADSREELAGHITRLAEDEEHRLEIARCARKTLEEELANPHMIWAGWRDLFAEFA